MTIHERTVESITAGRRHRTELGDMNTLMESIRRLGLLQPITVTPDGVLICGRRRLEAVKRLGQRTVKVWVRTGISEGLEMLVAEMEENSTHKPLSQLEQAQLYAEIRTLMREDAARRQEASRFGSGESPEPALTLVGSRHERESRAGAARFVSGTDSHQRLERILAIERIAADRGELAVVRQQAEKELEGIRNSAPVEPAWERVQACMEWEHHKLPGTPAEFNAELDATFKAQQTDRRRRIKENRERRQAQARNRRRSPRAFTLMWAELNGWTHKYEPRDIAEGVKPDDWKLFLDTVAECHAFIDDVERIRAEKTVPEAS